MNNDVIEDTSKVIETLNKRVKQQIKKVREKIDNPDNLNDVEEERLRESYKHEKKEDQLFDEENSFHDYVTTNLEYRLQDLKDALRFVDQLQELRSYGSISERLLIHENEQIELKIVERNS